MTNHNHRPQVYSELPTIKDQTQPIIVCLVRSEAPVETWISIDRGAGTAYKLGRMGMELGNIVSYW